MTTIEPRISVTPSPTTGPMLREIAKLTGKPLATVVREMLDEMAPVMPELIDALRKIHTRPEEAQAGLARMAAGMVRDLSQAQLDLDAAIKQRPGRKPGKRQGRGAAKT